MTVSLMKKEIGSVFRQYTRAKGLLGRVKAWYTFSPSYSDKVIWYRSAGRSFGKVGFIIRIPAARWSAG